MVRDVHVVFFVLFCFGNNLNGQVKQHLDTGGRGDLRLVHFSLE